MTKRGTPDGARQNGPALEKAYQFALWLVPTVEKFPRSQKFLLGDRLQSLAYDVIEGLVEAVYNRDREKVLKLVNLRLQKLRLMVRLASDLHHLDKRRYEFAALGIDEIVQLVGGWLRTDRAQKE